MFAAVVPHMSPRQHIKTMIVAALLVLSLLAGATTTATQVDARKRQPQVICDHISQATWTNITGEDPGPGGYWDCHFPW